MAAVAAPAVPPPVRLRVGRAAGLLALVLGATLLLSPILGNVAIPPGLVVRILLDHLSGGWLVSSPCAGFAVSPRLCAAYGEIVWESRFPEVLLALGAGAALGCSGASLQGIFRNPLADPFLLGISSGATVGAALVFDFRIDLSQANLALPLFAFVGALATGGVILLAARSRFGSVETLLLTGVALSSFLSSLLSLLLLVNPTGSLQVDFWLLGNIGDGTWSVDGIVLGVLLITGTLLSLFGRELNLLQLGNDVAQSLGVDARRVRVLVLLLTCLTTAVAVAFTGIIGFVGLVSPHIIRRTFGTDYRIVVPGSAVVGGAFLLGARDLSVWVLPSSVLPIGIFTAFAGAPFFAYLLYRRRSRSPMGAV
ncbi:MAG TPA: iron ABC transporter permease [Thermoplasmata archaeon]|nr:iron ABC transporter permease [Thermoplasmata archaeon]